ncbi:hypothetical protein HOF92_16000 [bacterium]|nr:hypothetical protein [bacterium]
MRQRNLSLSWTVLCLMLSSYSLTAREDPFSQYEEILNKRVEPKAVISSPDKPQVKSSSGSASAGLRLGTCDFSLLLLFHPRMKDYNFRVRSFRAPLPKTLDVPAQFYLKQMQEKRGAYLRALGTREELLRQSLARVVQELLSLKQDFQKKMAEITAKGGTKAQSAAKIMEQTEDRYFESRLNFEQKQNQLKEDFAKWTESARVELYVPEDQRNNILQAISREVRDLLTTLSEDQKIDVVFNRSLRTTRGPLAAPRKSPDFYKLANYENSFSQFLERPLAVGEGNAALSTRGLFRGIAVYLSRYEEIYSYFKPVLSRHLFLGEPIDLTFVAIAQLWESYKIPEQRAAPLLTALKNWSRKG